MSVDDYPSSSVNQIHQIYVGQRIYKLNDEKFGTILKILPSSSIKNHISIKIKFDNKNFNSSKISSFNENDTIDEVNEDVEVVSIEDVYFGNSFQFAVNQKYINLANQDELDNELQRLNDGNAKPFKLEFVGVEKANTHFKKIDLLESIILCSSFISHWDVTSKLVLPELKYLDLDHNLLYEWRAVNSILKNSSKLQHLCLSRNRFVGLNEEGEEMCFNNLLNLELNETFMNWKEIHHLSNIFPNLMELSLCGNKLYKFEADLQMQQPSFKNLNKLCISENCISDWCTVFLIVFYFPSLTHLELYKNKLMDEEENVIEEGKVAAQKKFMELQINSASKDDVYWSHRCESMKYLSIEENEIKKWRTIGDLSQLFFNLENLRWALNPLHSDPVHGNVQFSRMIITALFPKLKSLNGGTLTKVERIACEKYFLSLVTKNHPIVEEIDSNNMHSKRLLLQHGEIISTPAADATTADNTQLSRSLVSVILSYELPNSISTVHKKIPNTMTIRSLKMMFSRLFNVPVSSQKLLYSDKNSPISIPFDEEDKTLLFYGASDGLQIRLEKITNC